jgi:hypothetical protein
MSNRTQNYPLVRLNLSYSWSSLDEDQPLAEVTAVPNHQPPSTLLESTMFVDHTGSLNIFGGSLVTSNISNATTASPVSNTKWTLSGKNNSWSSSTIPGLDFSYLPMHALSVQAPDQDLVFALNGVLRDGQSGRVFPKMIVLNTRTNHARTVSTESIAPFSSRTEGMLQYLPLLGKKGALLLLGGTVIRSNDNVTTDPLGTMVKSHPRLKSSTKTLTQIRLPLTPSMYSTLPR